MDQPIILRENRSTTTARYNQPSLDSFNFKLFGIKLTIQMHLRVILNDSEVSIKPVAIQLWLTTPKLSN